MTKHRWGVRTQLTAFYGGLFLLLGAALLAITYLLLWQALNGQSVDAFPTIGTYSQPTQGYAQPPAGYAQPAQGYAPPSSAYGQQYAQPSQAYPTPQNYPQAYPSAAAGAAVAGAAMTQPGGSQQHVSTQVQGAGEQNDLYPTHEDTRFGHDHAYPNRGVVVREVPKNATVINYAGLSYH